MNTADLNRRQAVHLVQTLAALGLKHAVLSPGARNTPVVLALHDAVEQGCPIQLHSVVDERAAGFFALGLARQTDTPVLLSCTSGSAAANYFPAVVEASEGAVPLIVVTADRPAELQNCGAPQAMAQVALFGVHVRRSISLEAPEVADATSLVSQATRDLWAASVFPAPGPVHLNLRFRKPLWSPDSTATLDAPVAPVVPRPSSCDPACIQRLVEFVDGQAGVIVVGPDPSGRLKGEDIDQLSRWLQWPVLADPVSQLRFGADVPVIHHHDILLRSARFRELHPYTRAIHLGGTTSSRPLEELLRRTPTVPIGASGRRWDPWGSVDWSLEASLAAVMQAVAQAAVRPQTPDHREQWQAADRVVAEGLVERCSGDLWEGSIAHHFVQALPAGALLRIASSMPIRDVDSFCVDSGRTLRVSANRGVNGIDGTVATTLGEAAAIQQPVGLLTGDLSLIHDIGALTTAPRPSNPVVITVVDNGGGGIFGYLPMREHETAFEPWYVTPHQHDIPAIARAMGVAVHTPDSLDACKNAWNEALAHCGVTVVHVRIDREESTARHYEVWSALTAHLDEVLG